MDRPSLASTPSWSTSESATKLGRQSWEASSALHADVEEIFDPSSDRMFYHNTKTGKVGAVSVFATGTYPLTAAAAACVRADGLDLSRSAR